MCFHPIICIIIIVIIIIIVSVIVVVAAVTSSVYRPNRAPYNRNTPHWPAAIQTIANNNKGSTCSRLRSLCANRKLFTLQELANQPVEAGNYDNGLLSRAARIDFNHWCSHCSRRVLTRLPKEENTKCSITSSVSYKK